MTKVQTVTGLKDRSSTHNRIKKYGLVMSALSAVFLFSETASAFCSTGNGAARTFALPLTMPWGKEEPRTSTTCDGDKIYLGRVRDLQQDGQSVEVRISRNSNMSGEREFASSGRMSGTAFRLYGTFYLRICKSGVPLGQSNKRDCSSTVAHIGS